MERVVDEINALEPAISSLSDRDLAAKTDEFRNSHRGGESLDQLLPKAFAVVREAGSRRLGFGRYSILSLASTQRF